MLDLSSILEHISLEDADIPIDHAFIANFLAPFFPDIPPDELAAKVAEVITAERMKRHGACHAAPSASH